MNITIISSIFFAVLSVAGFISFYFFFLPGVLVRRWLGSLESGSFSRDLYWNDYNTEVSGYKRNHKITISLNHHFIIPKFEITISLKDKHKYNFFFVEHYFRNHKKWDNKEILYKELFNIYYYNSWARNAIVKFSNQKIRNALIHFISSKFKEQIFDHTIILEYQNLFFYPVLFFKKKRIQVIIDKALDLSRILAYTTDDEIIRENMEKEDNINIKILNMILLFTTCELKNNRALYEEYLNSDNKTLSIIARCGLQKEKYTDIEHMIKGPVERDMIFALENLPKFKIKKEKKKALLSFVLDNYKDYMVYSFAIESLVEILKIQGQKLLYKFIKKNEEEFNSIDFSYFCRVIGENKYTKCSDFVLSNLETDDEYLLVNAINALKGLGDVKAVEYLIPFTRGIRPVEVKKAAHDAIAKLQHGVTPEEKGGLSFVEIEKEDGQLSLYDEDKKGGLSTKE